jgi:hypothetical protein
MSIRIYYVPRESLGGTCMENWLWVVLAVAVWFIVNRWVLPRLGVKT